MDLVMIRHGKAGERDPKQWPDDDLRPLTDEGVSEMRAVLKAAVKMGVEPDVLLTSPLLRAKQTASLAAEVFGHGAPAEDEALGHGCTLAGVVKLLAKQPARATVAIVGHEPDFSRIAAQLIGTSGDAALELKKGGIIGVTFDGAPAAGAGRLSYLLKPAHLRKVGRRKR